MNSRALAASFERNKVARAPDAHQDLFLEPLQQEGNDGYFTLQKVPAPLNFLPNKARVEKFLLTSQQANRLLTAINRARKGTNIIYQIVIAVSHAS